MTEEERIRATIISNWLNDHPGVNYHVAPQNRDNSYHILVWRGEEIWVGPDYIVDEGKFHEIEEDPIKFLDKAYLDLLQIEKLEKERACFRENN